MSGRWWRISALWAVLCCACTGGQSTDPGSPGGSQKPFDAGMAGSGGAGGGGGAGGSGGMGVGGDGGNSGGAPPPCEFELWQSRDDRPQHYHCEGATSDTGESLIECDCDGRTERELSPLKPGEQLVDVCDDVLAQLCGIDRGTRTHCEHASGGNCWPSSTASDAWLCDCGDGGMLTEVQSDDCYAAGEGLCAIGPATCEDKNGHCTRRANTAFDCVCVESAPDVQTITASQCATALAECAPPSSPSDVLCMEGTAHCDLPSSVDTGICHCEDGSQKKVARNALGIACLTLLQMVCNMPPPADLGMCSSGGFDTGTLPSGHCDHNNSKDPGDGFECQCLPGPDNAFEARFGKVDATTCEQALAYFCPEVPP